MYAVLAYEFASWQEAEDPTTSPVVGSIITAPLTPSPLLRAHSASRAASWAPRRMLAWSSEGSCIRIRHPQSCNEGMDKPPVIRQVCVCIQPNAIALC